jgi:hypothetical protein
MVGIALQYYQPSYAYDLSTQSGPRSKHTPPRLQKPVC